MEITIVSGTHCAAGQSDRIADVFAQKIKAAGHTAHVLNLHTVNMPMWDEGMWGKEGLTDTWQQKWQPWAEKLQASDAIIVIAPEYAGMASPHIKNFLLLATKKEVGHKAGLIVSVSAGMNGAYPVSELRSHSMKNNSLCWIPDHLIIRQVQHMFTEGLEGELAQMNEMITARTDFTLSQLYAYAEALKNMRENHKVMDDAYPFGM